MVASSKKKRSATDAQTGEEHGEGYMALGSEAATPSTGKSKRTKSTEPSGRLGTSSSGEQQSKVVYIGNLPHGFYEKQMLGFFSQFGKVTKVRLSRNKKSGKARHYAFLEFQYPEVAKIAAEAMDGYFMFKQKLTCKVMSPEKIHPQLFQGANRKFRDIPWRKLERHRHGKERTPEEQAKRIAQLVKKDQKRQERILAAGIAYEYSGLQDQLPVQPKKIKIS